MNFASPLQSGRLVQRYKRFLADIDLDGGGRITAACPNTGSMLGLTAPGSRVWVSKSDSATRKYPHTWEMIEAGAGKAATLVGINTSLPNTLVAEAITTQRIPELDGYAGLRREVKYGVNSRIDLLLEGGKSGQACYVEIKNVHLLRKCALAEFPDCRTERGVKHLAELSAMAAAGHRAVMLFLVQRADAKRFAIAPDLDPAYATAFKRAQSAGVEMLSYGCRLSPEGIEVARRLDIAEPS